MLQQSLLASIGSSENVSFAKHSLFPAEKKLKDSPELAITALWFISILANMIFYAFHILHKQRNNLFCKKRRISTKAFIMLILI